MAELFNAGEAAFIARSVAWLRGKPSKDMILSQIWVSVGGHLLFDLIVHTGLGKPASFVQKIRVPEGVAIWNEHVDPKRGRSRVEMLSWYRTNDGEPRAEREVHRQRWYPIELLCHLACAAGLTVRGVYDLYPWRPASSMSAWVKFITQRRR